MGQLLRSGICTDQNIPWLTPVERWKLFEDLGFDSVWDCDHNVVAIGGLGIAAPLAPRFSMQHV